MSKLKFRPSKQKLSPAATMTVDVIPTKVEILPRVASPPSEVPLDSEGADFQHEDLAIAPSELCPLCGSEENIVNVKLALWTFRICARCKKIGYNAATLIQLLIG